MAKDSLISLGGNLENPRDAKASDFPAVGPSGAAGMQSGKDQLTKQSDAQVDNNSVMPSSFAVQKNKGEGAGQSSVSTGYSVDLNSGAHTC